MVFDIKKFKEITQVISLKSPIAKEVTKIITKEETKKARVTTPAMTQKEIQKRQKNIFGQDVTAIQEKIGEVITKPPIVAGIETIQDFWTLVLGTPKEKAKTVVEYYGTKEEEKQIIPKIEEWTWQGADQPILTFPGLPSIELPKIEFPDILGGLKNALLIGGVFIGGIYLLGKFLGRGK